MVVGMWGKGTWWFLARGLFYWAGASAMMTGGEVKGIRIIVWGMGAGGWATATPAPAAASGRLHDENKQPKVVHPALHAAFAFWASQPASHLLP